MVGVDLNTMNILLIDDRDDHNYLNEIIIEQTGLFKSINSVTSGLEALEYLRVNDLEGADLPFPDLIFLDINMPFMNGWEFLEGLEQLAPSLSKVPKVYMLSTSNAVTDIKRSTQYHSVKGYISKPLDEKVLSNIHYKEAS